MKRSLSLILAILFTLSCLVVGASVTASAETPEGTGINDLSALNGSSGTFYLTENITVSESVASFSGTLDGNGKTITTSVPVFAALSGATVKNLTIAGTIDYVNTAKWGGCGALVCNVTGDLTLNNVVNSASVTVNAHVDHDGVGGLVGVVTTGALSLTNCSNTGAVTGNTDANKQVAGGGLIGYVIGSGAVSVTGCSNTGTLTGNSDNINLMGGIFGWYNRNAAYTFENCVNQGTITSPKGGKLGGLVGVNNGAYTHTFNDCTNQGAVTVTATIGGFFGGFVADELGILIMDGCTNHANVTIQTNSTVAVYAGGFVGYYRSTSTAASSFTDCANKGNVSSASTNGTNLLGGLVGYGSTTTPITFTRCVNEGTISATKEAGGVKGGGIIGVSEKATAGFEDCVNKGNIQMGSLSGGLFADARKNVTVTGCINLGIIQSTNTTSNVNAYAGGLAAQVYGAIADIRNSANYGAISASAADAAKASAGGIIYLGGNAGGSFIDLANYGAVSGSQYVGGIIGNNTNAGTMTRCANFATVTATTGTARALNGNGSNLTVTDCYGTIAPDSTYQGANAAATCFGLNFGGGTWILREGYPELAFVETVLGSKEKSADPTVVYKGVQQTAVSDGKFAIRVVEGVVVPDLVNNNPFQYVGMEIIFAKAGDAAVKGANRYSRYVYTSILAGTDANGIPSAWGGSTETDAGWVDGTFYSALTVTEIPAEGTYTVIVKPYTTSAEGEHTKSYGDAYAFLCTDGVIVADSTYLFAAPARTN